MIIAFTGMPLSGKTVASKILSRLGLDSFKMSSAVIELMEKEGIEITNRNLRTFAEDLRKKHGREVVARLCFKFLDEVKSAGKGDVLIDGLRGMEELEEFKKRYMDFFVVVGVWASERTRFRRAIDRKRKDESLTKEEFEWRDRVEVGYGIPEVMVRADYMIVNEGSMKEFEKKVLGLYNTLTASAKKK